MYVFDSILVKTKLDCPKYVSRKIMGDQMAVKEVGILEILHESMENIKYDLFRLKDPDYSINIISTFGELLVPTGQK